MEADNFVVDAAASGAPTTQLQDVLRRPRLPAPPLLFRRSYVCVSREIETTVTARRSFTTELSLACARALRLSLSLFLAALSRSSAGGRIHSDN